MSANLFGLVSALDFRYLRKDSPVARMLSEEAFTRAKLAVEIAVAKAFYKRGLVEQEAVEAIVAACGKVTAERVYAIEDSIFHDIRALVAAIREHLEEKHVTVKFLAPENRFF